MTREERYVIAAVRAVVNQVTPPQAPPDLDWEGAARLAVKHSVGNLFCYAVEKMEEVPRDILAKLVEYKKKAILREATQEIEISIVRKKFNAAGIRFMPLKGILLKNCYPKPDMRMMGDIDILFDESRAEDVREILQGMGYTACKYETLGSVDVYQKPPIMNLELHRTLLIRPKEWEPFFSDVWERAVQKDGSEYTMTAEDYYVFLIAHLLKHYVGYGTGIRSVLDVWVCRNAMKLDENVLKARFEALGITEFVKNIESLSRVWFGEEESTPLLDEMGDFIIMSGVYGEKLTAVMASTVATDSAKSEYFFRRLFLKREVLVEEFPILEKHPALTPLCWVSRIAKRAFKKDIIMREMKMMQSVDGDKASALQNLHKRAGIKESMFQE